MDGTQQEQVLAGRSCPRSLEFHLNLSHMGAELQELGSFYAVLPVPWGSDGLTAAADGLSLAGQAGDWRLAQAGWGTGRGAPHMEATTPVAGVVVLDCTFYCPKPALNDPRCPCGVSRLPSSTVTALIAHTLDVKKASVFLPCAFSSMVGLP